MAGENSWCEECRKSVKELDLMVGRSCDVCLWPLESSYDTEGVSIFHHIHYKVCPDCGAKTALHASLVDHVGGVINFRREVGLPREGKHIGRLHAITRAVLTYIDHGKVRRVVVPAESTVTLALIHYNLREAANVKG